MMRSIFSQELAAASVIAVGTSPALSGFYHRTIRLRRKEQDGPEIAPVSPYLQAAE